MPIRVRVRLRLGFFFFNDTATTEIYTLSLHDALPICNRYRSPSRRARTGRRGSQKPRSEEHTSELQSRQYLVCRLLLEKKTKTAHNLTQDARCPGAADARADAAMS